MIGSPWVSLCFALHPSRVICSEHHRVECSWQYCHRVVNQETAFKASGKFKCVRLGSSKLMKWVTWTKPRKPYCVNNCFIKLALLFHLVIKEKSFPRVISNSIHDWREQCTMVHIVRNGFSCLLEFYNELSGNVVKFFDCIKLSEFRVDVILLIQRFIKFICVILQEKDNLIRFEYSVR